MSNDQTNFWRGFTRKRFARNTFLFFAISLTVGILFAWFDKNETISGLFAAREIIKRVLSALLFGFLFAVWYEPGMIKKK